MRSNRAGELIASSYGLVSAVHLDPIEKKPLYPFHPATEVLSLGSVGCNMSCRHCQNWLISTAGLDMPRLETLTPKDVVQSCLRKGSAGIAWTYNEPTLWQEFVVDTSRLAREQGLFSVWVTNGYIQPEALDEVCECTDAMNVDVKGFTDNFYRDICGARLQPVLDTVERAHRNGLHLEITYLLIPTHNDGRDEISDFCDWAASIDRGMPVHFSRFHPDHLMMDVPPTPLSTLEMARDLARDSGMEFVYLGNVLVGNDTVCPSCGAVALERRGYRVTITGVSEGRCRRCGHDLRLVGL